MENLLKQYIAQQSCYECSEITIDNYNVSGSECIVDYRIYEYYKETIIINIWNMLIFIESQKTNK